MATETLSDQYKEEISLEITSCVKKMCCQPIIFAGSGLSKRYFNGPSWDELLAILAKRCPLIDKEYAYYKQTLKHPLAIGEEFAKHFQRWAWDKGKNQFPAEMFGDEVSEQAYIKYTIAEHIKSITPNALSAIVDPSMQLEIAALQSMKPHAIITTNYDTFLETVFPDYQPVIGQSIIQGTQVLLGEIFKIHGCVSDYDSLVFTQNDYDEFTRKKKYLSAKLLTYFSEHPLVFVGYSASDPNIRAILSDIDECMPRRGLSTDVIQNIFIVERLPTSDIAYVPARERLIAIDQGRSIRIKSIETDDFSWVFSAFGAHQPLNAVSPKLLRALLHRSYDLVRHDIPRQTVHADFQMLEQAVESETGFAKLFGITTISRPSSNAVDYPYTLTDLAEKVTGKKNAYWSEAQTYIQKIKMDKNIDIKGSDNLYHSATKSGKKSVVHKYSNHLVELIQKIKDGEEYSLQL